MPALFREYVVMGHFVGGANGYHYTYDLADAIAFANTWRFYNTPYWAEVKISDSHHEPALAAEAEALGVDCRWGIPLYETLRRR